MTTLFGNVVDESIEAIRMFCRPGYTVAYSGGKDSVVLLDLAKRAGVPFVARHNFTTIDPPELVRFVRKTPGIEIDHPAKSLVEFARSHGILPTRWRRWCCQDLKHTRHAGESQVVTGIRAAESTNRAHRQVVEPCQQRGIHIINPILYWSDEDVWGYIRVRGLAYCCLYDEGHRRLGCVMCPLSDHQVADEIRWPRIARIWRRAAEVVWQRLEIRGENDWSNPQALYDAWKSGGYMQPDDGPLPLLEANT